MVTIFCEFSFNSSHWLPHVHETHKCRRMHGHTYRVRITVGGPVGADGFVVDYDVVRKAWAGLHAIVDHRTLNEVIGLENPTCEVICEWIASRMVVPLAPARVVRVEVRETESCGATWAV